MKVTRLELARRIAGLNQAELAEMAGVHRVLVSQTERLYRRPHPALRRKLAEALGYPETVLFDRDGWPIPATTDDFSWLKEGGRTA